MESQTPRMRALTRRAALIGGAQVLALLAAACAPLSARPGAGGETATPAGLPRPSPTPDGPVPTANATCIARLPGVVPPTPIPYPGYTQMEPSTGLHVTAEPQIVDMATYRLTVKGKVARELSLTYEELRCLPKIGAPVTIECPGFFIDHSNLAGASLASVLVLAGPGADARRVNFTGVDGRTDTIALEDAKAVVNFLAYEWEGESLPISHGFPVRVALPGMAGGYWVKWLREIFVL